MCTEWALSLLNAARIAGRDLKLGDANSLEDACRTRRPENYPRATIKLEPTGTSTIETLVVSSTANGVDSGLGKADQAGTSGGTAGASGGTSDGSFNTKSVAAGSSQSV